MDELMFLYFSGEFINTFKKFNYIEIFQSSFEKILRIIEFILFVIFFMKFISYL